MTVLFIVDFLNNAAKIENSFAMYTGSTVMIIIRGMYRFYIVYPLVYHPLHYARLLYLQFIKV